MRPRQAGKDGEAFEADLIRQESAGLLRVERTVEKPDARRIRMPDGQSGIDFSSNSYLGLHHRLPAPGPRAPGRGAGCRSRPGGGRGGEEAPRALAGGPTSSRRLPTRTARA